MKRSFSLIPITIAMIIAINLVTMSCDSDKKKSNTEDNYSFKYLPSVMMIDVPDSLKNSDLASSKRSRGESVGYQIISDNVMMADLLTMSSTIDMMMLDSVIDKLPKDGSDKDVTVEITQEMVNYFKDMISKIDQHYDWDDEDEEEIDYDSLVGMKFPARCSYLYNKDSLLPHTASIMFEDEYDDDDDDDEDDVYGGPVEEDESYDEDRSNSKWLTELRKQLRSEKSSRSDIKRIRRSESDTYWTINTVSWSEDKKNVTFLNVDGYDDSKYMIGFDDKLKKMTLVYEITWKMAIAEIDSDGNTTTSESEVVDKNTMTLQKVGENDGVIFESVSSECCDDRYEFKGFADNDGGYLETIYYSDGERQVYKEIFDANGRLVSSEGGIGDSYYDTFYGYDYAASINASIQITDLTLASKYINMSFIVVPEGTVIKNIDESYSVYGYGVFGEEVESNSLVSDYFDFWQDESSLIKSKIDLYVYAEDYNSLEKVDDSKFEIIK